MATNLLIRNCVSNETVELDFSTDANVAVSWGSSVGQISVAEVNYCPPGAVVTFRHNGVDVYTYVSQGLADSKAAFPMCDINPNPDGSSYSGPVDTLAIDVSAVTYPINLSSNLDGVNQIDWIVPMSFTHDGDINTKVYFTTDGSDPVTSTSRYMYNGSPVSLGGKNTPNNNIIFVKAVAINPANGQASRITDNLVMFARPIKLEASIEHGYHVDKNPIELLDTALVSIDRNVYYTVDGSDVLDFNGFPTAEAIEYAGPITPPSNQFVLKAVAVSTGLDTIYSNYLENYYRYEEDLLVLEANPAGGIFPETTKLVYLSANEIEAQIRYTLNGSSPLGEMAMIYEGDPIELSTELDKEDFHLRAVAVTDRLISEPIDINFTLYKYDGDADRDEISNEIEGGPATDTDSDGQADMFDVDSDNDGMPDYIEGASDSDGDSIPAFQDADETIPFWYEIEGLPESGDIINGLQYEIKVSCYGSPGHVVINTDNKALVFSTTDITIPAGETRIIHMLVPEVMENKCSFKWDGEPFDLTLSISHEENGETITEEFERTYEIKHETDLVAYKGNLVTWDKSNSAISYSIYRKNPAQDSFERIANILHDSYHTFGEQQYLDRDGEILSEYRVSAVLPEGEGNWSNVLHASDCGFPVCSVIGHLADASGSPMANIRVTGRIVTAAVMLGNTYLDKYEKVVYTDVHGQFVLDLPKGSVCMIKLEQSGVRQKVAIPMKDSIDLHDLLRLNSEGA